MLQNHIFINISYVRCDTCDISGMWHKVELGLHGQTKVLITEQLNCNEHNSLVQLKFAVCYQASVMDMCGHTYGNSLL